MDCTTSNCETAPQRLADYLQMGLLLWLLAKRPFIIGSLLRSTSLTDCLSSAMAKAKLGYTGLLLWPWQKDPSSVPALQ
jgi:hypothetical protein